VRAEIQKRRTHKKNKKNTQLDTKQTKHIFVDFLSTGP